MSKPPTPSAEAIISFVESAGPRGATFNEIRQEFNNPHAAGLGTRLIKLVNTNQLASHYLRMGDSNRYYLPQFAPPKPEAIIELSVSRKVKTGLLVSQVINRLLLDHVRLEITIKQVRDEEGTPALSMIVRQT